MCSAAGANRYAPNRADLNQTQIFELELRALAAWDDASAEEHLQRAVNLQDSTSFSFGPPIIAKPSYEMYGDWLMANKRFEEAALQYTKALEKGPKRIHALKGKMEALAAAGKISDANAVRAELQEVVKDADGEVKNRFVVKES